MGSPATQDRGRKSRVNLLALSDYPDYLATSAEEGRLGAGAILQSQLGFCWCPRHQQSWTQQKLLFP